VEKLREYSKCALNQLSNADYEEFKNSLSFNRGGLAHANYTALKRTLSLQEIFNVFLYFGLGKIYLMDIVDYYCESAGTCKYTATYVCTSAC
jgi:hypothetical protein